MYGGGDTAIDAARTARRLGATDAVIVYRRTRQRMPAHDIEVEEATEEGIRMMWLSTIARAEEGKLTIEKMRLDEQGLPQPTGEFDRTGRRLAWFSRLASRPIWPCWTGSRGSSSPTTWSGLAPI